MKWYQDEKRARPDKPVYEIPEFCAATLGEAGGSAVRAKGAESGTLMAFSVSLARKFRDRLPQRGPLLACGETLLQYMQITREDGWKLPLPACQQLVDCCSRVMTLREAANIAWRPKFHMFAHLVHGARRFGNPRLLGARIDEGLNRDLAAVCKSAHCLVWSRRVMSTFGHAFGPTLDKKGRKYPRR